MVTNRYQLKMTAKDGKQGLTGVTTAKRARQELEAKTGNKVVSGENFLPPAQRKGIAKK